MQDPTETVAEGKIAVFETDGAKSFDGTHYTWNVNVSSASFHNCARSWLTCLRKYGGGLLTGGGPTCTTSRLTLPSRT